MTKNTAAPTKDQVTEAVVAYKERHGILAAKTLIRKVGHANALANVLEQNYAALFEACQSQPPHKARARKVGKPTQLSAPYGAIQPDHHSSSMAQYTIGLPGDLNSNTTKLVLDFANAMGRKLFAAQQKHDYEDDWKQDVEGGGFESDDVLRECMFQHMLKGDPVDVANYAAFAAYHGATTAPDADEAELWIRELQRKFGLAPTTGHRVISADMARQRIAELQSEFDLHDENAMLRGVMDAMEERHGDQFNAFFDSIMLRVLMATGLPSITLDTAALFQQVAGKDTTGHYVEIVEAPGNLTYVLRQSGDVLHTDLLGNVESIKPEAPTIKVGWLDDCPLCKCDVADVKTFGTKEHLNAGDEVSCERCGLQGTIEADDNSAYVSWEDKL